MQQEIPLSLCLWQRLLPRHQDTDHAVSRSLSPCRVYRYLLTVLNTRIEGCIEGGVEGRIEGRSCACKSSPPVPCSQGWIPLCCLRWARRHLETAVLYVLWSALSWRLPRSRDRVQHRGAGGLAVPWVQGVSRLSEPRWWQQDAGVWLLRQGIPYFLSESCHEGYPKQQLEMLSKISARIPDIICSSLWRCKFYGRTVVRAWTAEWRIHRMDLRCAGTPATRSVITVTPPRVKLPLFVLSVKNRISSTISGVSHNVTPPRSTSTTAVMHKLSKLVSWRLVWWRRPLVIVYYSHSFLGSRSQEVSLRQLCSASGR